MLFQAEVRMSGRQTQQILVSTSSHLLSLNLPSKASNPSAKPTALKHEPYTRESVASTPNPDEKSPPSRGGRWLLGLRVRVWGLGFIGFRV